MLCAYAPQVGCDEEEKEEFWNDLGYIVAGIPNEELLWIGADLDGHVGVGNEDASKEMEKHGVGERIESGERNVEFANAQEMAVVNSFFKKSLTRSIACSSGGNGTQVDNILCRRRDLKTARSFQEKPWLNNRN